MKIGIIGGTGDLGKGLALRWSANHIILVGSRSREKAEMVAKKYSQIAGKFYGKEVKIIGSENFEAAQSSDIVVLAVPFQYIYDILEKIKETLYEKIVISPIVPLKKIDNNFVYTPPKEGSAALLIKKYLPESTQIVSAFHNIPAKKLAKLDAILEYDVLVCGDEHAKSVVFDLVREIKNLRPLDAGPIEISNLVESVTPLLLNVSYRNKIKSPSIKVVS